jgi:hypothetical protein
LFSNRKVQQFALILNLLGTVTLFYSFQATSSNLKVVTFNDRTALCIYGQTMIMTGKNGMQMFGQEPCPDGPTTKAFAVVNIEHPIFVWVGFLSLFLGFVIQVFAVPRPQTEAMMRAELKLLKAQQGQAKPL